MRIGETEINLDKVNYFCLDYNFLENNKEYGIYAITETGRVACIEHLSEDEANRHFYALSKGLVAQGYHNYVLLNEDIINVENVNDTKVVGNLLSNGYINFEFKCGHNYHLYHDMTERVYDVYNEFKKMQRNYESKKLSLVC